MRATIAGLILVALLLLALLCSGCGSGGAFPTFTGGGIPPGESDIGGVVLAQSVAGAAPAQSTTPVVGAEVGLYHGSQKVGETTTGTGGYFSFVDPDSGSYKIIVNPPPGSRLKAVGKVITHTKGQKTFVTIILPPA